MTLWEQIVNTYPELTDKDFGFQGSIRLQNDGDGAGDYIAKWEYSKPIPDGLTLGKPTA
jgi:hypothetical protein